VSVSAAATARIGAAASLDNASLRATSPGYTVGPLLVNLNQFTACTGSCFQSPGTLATLRFQTADRNGSGLGIAVPAAYAPSAGNPDPPAFENWVHCYAPCDDAAFGTASDYPALDGTNTDIASPGAIAAISSLIGRTLLLPVFNHFDAATDRYHIVGFATFQVTAPPHWEPDNIGCWPDIATNDPSTDNCKYISGTFTHYTAPGTFTPGTCDLVSGQNCDFGVEQFALTS
jgi:hypothetical protein